MLHPHIPWWGCRDTLGGFFATLEFVISVTLPTICLLILSRIQDMCDRRGGKEEHSGSYGHWGEFFRDAILYIDIERSEKLAKMKPICQWEFKILVHLVSSTLHPMFSPPPLSPSIYPSSLPFSFSFLSFHILMIYTNHTNFN